MRDLRHDWTIPEIESIYAAPLPVLIFRAQGATRFCMGAAWRDRLLTTPNPGQTRDELLLDRLGMRLTAAGA